MATMMPITVIGMNLLMELTTTHTATMMATMNAIAGVVDPKTITGRATTMAATLDTPMVR